MAIHYIYLTDAALQKYQNDNITLEAYVGDKIVVNAIATYAGSWDNNYQKLNIRCLDRYTLETNLVLKGYVGDVKYTELRPNPNMSASVPNYYSIEMTVKKPFCTNLYIKKALLYVNWYSTPTVHMYIRDETYQTLLWDCRMTHEAALSFYNYNGSQIGLTDSVALAKEYFTIGIGVPGNVDGIIGSNSVSFNTRSASYPGGKYKFIGWSTTLYPIGTGDAEFIPAMGGISLTAKPLKSGGTMDPEADYKLYAVYRSTSGVDNYELYYKQFGQWKKYIWPTE